VPRSGRSLELGCGTGEYSLWLAARGFEVSGVDLSPTAVAWARERFAARGVEADLRVGSVLDLSEFAPASFDLVLDGHCFHCIVGNDRAAFLENAYRVLRPGGIFHVATMCGPIHDPKIQELFDPATSCVLRNGVAIRQVKSPEEILQEMERAGFRILHHELDPPKNIHDQTDLLANATR
jgi:ubiquinone/menaquinone biosynthesis C-methylase UbiE